MRYQPHEYIIRGTRFVRGDAFIGYQKDTPAAVVFQATNFLRRFREEDNADIADSKLEVLNRAGILDNMSLEMLLDREEMTEQWRAAVCYSIVSVVLCQFFF